MENYIYLRRNSLLESSKTDEWLSPLISSPPNLTSPSLENNIFQLKFRVPNDYLQYKVLNSENENQIKNNAPIKSLKRSTLLFFKISL